MAELGAYILDHQTLYELKSRLDYSGDTMLKVLEGVDNYLEGVKEVLKKQVDILREQWEEAQRELSEAEDALSACEASQTWDEEDQEYHPSCNWERSAVERARDYEYKCREKYERGERILSEVEYEITKYKEPGGVIAPPGAEKYLENLAKDHTHKAIQKLDDIIEIVERYLRFGVTLSHPGADQVSIPEKDNTPEPTSSPTPEDKAGAFNRGTQKVIEANEKIESATRVMVCERCGRPIPLCICPRIREREY